MAVAVVDWSRGKRRGRRRRRRKGSQLDVVAVVIAVRGRGGLVIAAVSLVHALGVEVVTAAADESEKENASHQDADGDAGFLSTREAALVMRTIEAAWGVRAIEAPLELRAVEAVLEARAIVARR